MQFQTLHQTVQYFAKNVQKFEIFENSLNNLQEIGPSSNQEGSSPFLSQLSTTVVRQLLDLKKERKDQQLDLKRQEKI